MDMNWLNIVLVVSFAVVSLALGLKWCIEAIIDYRLAMSGLKRVKQMEEEADYDE